MTALLLVACRHNKVGSHTAPTFTINSATSTIGTQDMLIQIGLEFSCSDANLAQGLVAVAVGVRK